MGNAAGAANGAVGVLEIEPSYASLSRYALQRSSSYRSDELDIVKSVDMQEFIAEGSNWVGYQIPIFGTVLPPVIDCMGVHQTKDLTVHIEEGPGDKFKLSRCTKCNIMGARGLVKLFDSHVEQLPITESDMSGFICHKCCSGAKEIFLSNSAIVNGDNTIVPSGDDLGEVFDDGILDPKNFLFEGYKNQTPFKSPTEKKARDAMRAKFRNKKERVLNLFPRGMAINFFRVPQNANISDVPEGAKEKPKQKGKRAAKAKPDSSHGYTEESADAPADIAHPPDAAIEIEAGAAFASAAAEVFNQTELDSDGDNSDEVRARERQCLFKIQEQH